MCGAAQLVARRLAVRLGSALQGGSPTEQTSDEDMERGLSELCDCMIVIV